MKIEAHIDVHIDSINQEAIMAILQEVKDEIEATRTEVAATRGVAASAVTLIDKLLGLIGSAAASATDLDELKTSIASIHTEVSAEKADLAAAVARNP